MDDTEITELYDDLVKFYSEHIEFYDPFFYKLLVSYTLLTWRIEQTKELAYLAFIGPSGSGKTRALQCLDKVCYNTVNTAYISKSVLYRKLTIDQFTFLCDEFENKLCDKELITILNAGYTRGQKAILNVRNSDGNWVPSEFEVYGPKVIASIITPTGPFASRCIIISMIKNTSDNIRFEIDEEVVDALIPRLQRYRKESEKSIANAYEIMSDEGIKDRRLMQLFNVLVSVTPEEYIDEFIEYIKLEEDLKNQAEETEPYAAIFRILDKLIQESGCGDKVLIRDVAERLRIDPDLYDLDITNRRVANWMSSMGYIRSYHTRRGNGRIIDQRIHERNRMRYVRD